MDHNSPKYKQLVEARTALKKSGRSPKELERYNLREALSWIYRWGFSTPSILALHLDKKSSAPIKKMIDRGWLISTRTESGTPKYFVTLSQSGLQEAEKFARTLLPYNEIDPYKVNQKLLRHNLLCQKLTLEWWIYSAINNFRTEREIFVRGDKRNIKRPDAIWVDGGGDKIGVEVELSSKWGRDLDEFIFGIVSALHETKDHPPTLQRFIVFSDSPAILHRYRQALSPDTKFNVWEKNSRGHWVPKAELSVPAYISARVEFNLVED